MNKNPRPPDIIYKLCNFISCNVWEEETYLKLYFVKHNPLFIKKKTSKRKGYRFYIDKLLQDITFYRFKKLQTPDYIIYHPDSSYKKASLYIKVINGNISILYNNGSFHTLTYNFKAFNYLLSIDKDWTHHSVRADRISYEDIKKCLFDDDYISEYYKEKQLKKIYKHILTFLNKKGFKGKSVKNIILRTYYPLFSYSVERIYFGRLRYSKILNTNLVKYLCLPDKRIIRKNVGQLIKAMGKHINFDLFYYFKIIWYFTKDINYLNQLAQIALKISKFKKNALFNKRYGDPIQRLTKELKLLIKICPKLNVFKIIKCLFCNYLNITQFSHKGFTFLYTDTINMIYAIWSEDNNKRYNCSSIKELHDACVKDYNKIKFKEIALPKPKIKKININNFQIIFPNTNHELLNWGYIFHNCVSSYVDRIIREECYVGAIKLNDSFLYCFEIRKNKVVQLSGKYDDSIDNKHLLIVSQLFKSVDLKFINGSVCND